jgi:hypothetical protein
VARLFGRDYTRQQVLEHVGDVSQVAGLRRLEVAEGRGKGVGLVECWTGSGLRFAVALDRAMDIPFASIGGVPLCWHGPPGLVAPAFYEPEGTNWLWTFAGGLLATCGLVHAGHPSDIPSEPHGLHGRIGAIPAESVSLDSRWEGDDYVMRIRGTCREARVFGPHLTLERTITTRLGERSFLIEDVVTNHAHAAQAHMMLYHFNIGWPIVDSGSRLCLRAAKVEPFDEQARRDPAWDTFIDPQPNRVEGVHFITPTPDERGRITAALVNRSLHGGHGLGVYLRYAAAALPCFVEWRMMGQGHYVVGMEPCNCFIHPRSTLAASGALPRLAPGESRRYAVEIGVVSGPSEIGQVAP